MKVKYTEQIERHYYSCDICGEKIVQDGKDICLVYGRCEEKGAWGKPNEPQYHLHENCLQGFLEENLPNLS